MWLSTDVVRSLFMCMCVSLKYTHTHTHTHTPTHTNTPSVVSYCSFWPPPTFVFCHTHTHARARAHTHTHTHTHIDSTDGRPNYCLKLFVILPLEKEYNHIQKVFSFASAVHFQFKIICHSLSYNEICVLIILITLTWLFFIKCAK